MASKQERDEEAADGFANSSRLERYRDDPDDADDEDEDTFTPDAPLRVPQRPSEEFDDLLRRVNPTWRDRIAQRIPPRLKKAWASTVKWVKGPQPPRIYHITPFFSKVQHLPIALLDRWAPKKVHRFWLLIMIYACWLLSFSLVLWKSSFSAEIPGYGTPVRLGCQARYWSNGNGCGLNGDQCRPFANAHLAFRCPAECRRAEILNPHAVGDQEVVYQPLVVGGPTDNQTGLDDEIVQNAVYRGDSFICSSAVHAGFINDKEGGCGVLTLTGEQPSFAESRGHGISSVGFDSYFPHSFGFIEGTRSQCKDLRWPAVIVTIFFTVIISLFTTSPAVFFWSVFVMLFFNTALASDPPSLTDYYGLLSIAFGRFLPACFCAWVTYRYSVQRSLTDLTAQIEKTILWLGPAWAGALNNYTFDKIPIQRLTPHDIQAQPGAVPALITIILTIFAIALGQAWAFRIEGRMPRYLLIYSILVVSLLILITIPGLSLRIHHYILAACWLACFINGVARWGFASIVETPADLLRGAPQGSILPAITVLAMGARNITFNLGPLPVYNPKSGRTLDGISILVNDVERFRGYGDDQDYWPDGWIMGGNFTWTWKRHKIGRDPDDSPGDGDDLPGGGDDEEMNAETLVPPEYFRFAYMGGSSVADYTKAGRWSSDGTWTDMEPGPS